MQNNYEQVDYLPAVNIKQNGKRILFANFPADGKVAGKNGNDLYRVAGALASGNNSGKNIWYGKKEYPVLED